VATSTTNASKKGYRGFKGSCCVLKALYSQYIKYRMAIRDEFNVFILGRLLFQQWLVDNYVKIEKDRINYCKDQKELRTETYQGLKDYIRIMANNSNGHIGKMVILHPHLLDHFVIYYKTIKIQWQLLVNLVDLFITMTYNPKWRIIQNRRKSFTC